ncbi:glycerophosphodiester phosphodiesterase [Tundrisphaera lichenicola]|uniref:glycerophosphodiester phosphodiesterase n=1 Tax=Tundrisphaera lichenicola TaxID=2029860 RepID=UPI003EB9E9BB
MILAHRGDSFHAPENTLEAARLGYEAGADGWELDVQLTRDRIPVVLHDESLGRTTDVARKFSGDPRMASGFQVADFTLDEIKSLDAGSWFVDPSGGARSATGFGTLARLDSKARTRYASGLVRIPTLAEALELTKSLDWAVNVEIKPSMGQRNSLVDAVLGAIRTSSTEDRVTVSSFDHETVRSVAKLEPGVATGALVLDGAIPDGDSLVEGVGAEALHAPFEAILLGKIKVVNRPLLTYTVNTSGLSGPILGLAAMGVMGIFTDDPAGLIRSMALNRS